MNWWSDFLTWANTDDGGAFLATVLVPFVAIVVAGLLAAWIASTSLRRLITGREREQKVAAIAGLVDAAEQASVWNSLTPQEQVLSDRATGQADIQVRLLPIRGAAVAADWAAYSLSEMKRNSATFGYQIEPAVIQFRDQLVEWQHRPARTRKAFQTDLDRWKSQSASTESQLRDQQEAWVAQQHHEQFAPPTRENPVRENPARENAAREDALRQPPASQDALRQPHAREEPTHPRVFSTPPAPPASTGVLDTQRVLDNVDALERQIDSNAR